MEQKVKIVLDYLEKLISSPKCELIFNNNFELICAVMLSAQTTDKRVNEISKALFSKYPDFFSLSLANYDDVYNIIKPLGLAKHNTSNLILLAKQICQNYNGIVPNSFEELCKLSGIGRKTANVVRALGFNIPAFPVDTHVNRVAKRLGLAKEDDDILTVEEKLKRKIPKNKWIDSHHRFLLFGRYTCKSLSPACQNCGLKSICKYKKSK